MDHTRTPGTEPPRAIPSQTMYYEKMKNDVPKVPKNKYTEDDIINMLEFLVGNIFVVFRERISNR